jgi:putative serine protease PepD
MRGVIGKRLAAGSAAIAAALAIAACGGSSQHRKHASGAPARTVTIAPASVDSNAAALQQQFVSVINHDAPEVVQVSNPQGLGSGIVFDKQGDIVTNAHVVAGGGPYKVTDSRGRSFPATLVGTFVEDDLAVVRVHGASLPVATFASSRSLHVGDIVLALGNPLGLRSSVTMGIISALGRTVSEPNGVVLPDVIQTSAPINPGNSGGALVNLQGQVVGIPTLAATDPQIGGAAPGIGFAIPSSVVTDIAGQITKYGHVVRSHRAYLGVELAAGLTRGAIVVAVQSGSPAARAGIRPGEVITAIAGQQVAGPEGVAEVLATLHPGQSVRVRLITASGARVTLKVKLGQYPGSGS